MRTLAPIDSRRSLEAVELDYDGQSSQELVQNPGVSSIFPAPSMSYRALPLLEADLSRQFYGSRCMGLVPSSPLLIQDYLNGNVLTSGEFVLPQVQKLVLFIKVCQLCQCYHPHRLTNILWPGLHASQYKNIHRIMYSDDYPGIYFLKTLFLHTNSIIYKICDLLKVSSLGSTSTWMHPHLKAYTAILE